ncbi:phosphodiester glycosidase family protein [Fodinisporobacter ferrooxydans]|uniref:Phosphodiester glycosidase family protein n=1 Tax=Fodinisporobacter ferrooxydans TaxID=2901836 RepID=A0ABY4CLT3_9BACL|nr:phosphodiester glycosidase family protein [Alicyclobacillaceae bacterium MYW30-H2]
MMRHFFVLVLCNRLTFVPDSDKSITGSINGSTKWDQTFYAWGINNNFHNSGQIVIFTPAYGDQTGIDTGTCVVVKQCKVAHIREGNSYIPPDGYVIYFGTDPNAAKYVDRFHYGDSISYQVQPLDGNKNPVDWTQVQSALSAGPMLVQNGQTVQPFNCKSAAKQQLSTANPYHSMPLLRSSTAARTFLCVLSLSHWEKASHGMLPMMRLN